MNERQDSEDLAGLYTDQKNGEHRLEAISMLMGDQLDEQTAVCACGKQFTREHVVDALRDYVWHVACYVVEEAYNECDSPSEPPNEPPTREEPVGIPEGAPIHARVGDAQDIGPARDGRREDAQRTVVEAMANAIRAYRMSLFDSDELVELIRAIRRDEPENSLLAEAEAELKHRGDELAEELGID